MNCRFGELLVTWDGLVGPSRFVKRERRLNLCVQPASSLPIAAHFFGKAKAMISSLVMSDPVRLPPVLTTVTYCLPSAPK